MIDFTMDSTHLILVTSFENAWARLSGNPDYQRCITSFFKAHSFYVGCPGLFAGTCKATGKRAVYCDYECCKRLSAELAALAAPWLGDQPQQLPVLPTECVEDVQALNLQSEDDVKALFKEFKRVARYHKQCRQLAAARELLLDARRWTAPFHAPPPPPPPVAAAAADAGCCPVTAPPGPAAAAAEAYTAAVTDAQSPWGPAIPAMNEQGPRPLAEGAPARAGCLLANGGGGVACGSGRRDAPRSHPISNEQDWVSKSEDDEGPSHCDRDDTCDGAWATQSRHRTVTGAGQTYAAAAASGSAAASFAAAMAAEAAVAKASDGACDLRPALRTLRTTACTDPWVSAAAAVAAAAPYLADASTPLSSGSSSIDPNSAVTPMWPPTTPRYGLAAPCAAAAAPPRLSNSDTRRCTGDAAGAGEERDVGPGAVSSGGGGGGGGGGSEGVLVVCCSIDLEWWERDNSRVTEVGWTMWDNLTQSLESRHHIVAEHEALVNRIHVPDHKHDFLFGRSTLGSLAEGAAALQSDLDHYGERVWAQWWAQQQRRLQQQQEQDEGQRQRHEVEQQGQGGGAAEPSASDGPDPARNAAGVSGAQPPCCGPADASASGPASASASAAGAAPNCVPPVPFIQVVVVGHGLSQDLKALSGLLGVALPAAAAILDTADLAWAALEAAPGQDRTAMSLRVLLKTLGIRATKLHNGGNDACYTLEAMLALAAMDAPAALRDADAADA